ncbi:hypothetical protein D3C72_1718840 [compost metagenome]
MVAEGKQFTDLIETEAQRLCPADEAQASQVLLAEDAVATCRARCGGQKLLTFVVADGIDGNACLTCQLTNVHGGLLGTCRA